MRGLPVTGRKPRLSFVVLLAVVTGTSVTAARPTPAVPANPDDRTILHVLNRIGFGARPGDVERVRQLGLQAYIDQQLHPERIPDTAATSRLSGLETLGRSPRELAAEYFAPAIRARREAKSAAGDASPEEKPMRTPEQMAAAQKRREVLEDLNAQKILRAIYSDRQLEEVMTDFWFNHFNVFAGKGATAIYLTEYERDVIRPHVLGKFRDLLGATAKSPAMLFYLDNWQSAAANTPTVRAALRRGEKTQARGLNENYGRELMELHTLGVDGGYTHQDVIEVARCFTGWTIRKPRRGGGFAFDPRLHDTGKKLVLGHVIAHGGERDGEEVLDILASHPSTARFISTKLARRFVSDDPPPSLVERAAARFRETDGDIREVVRTIITSPEFFAAAANRAKVKTPFEFVVSAVRSMGGDVHNAMPLAQAIRQLGEPLYLCQPPTGYADRAGAWVNTGTLLNRMNFAVAFAGGRLRGVEPGADAGEAAALILGSPEFQRR
jgi:uncharacterized protein (DUF1800 family)